MAKKAVKKVSLSRALKNHQANVAAAERARTIQAQREAAAKKRHYPKAKGRSHKTAASPKGKEKASALPERFVIPFEVDDRILLVGEGMCSDRPGLALKILLDIP